MGTTIADLPVELLTAILHRVHARSINDLLSCIGVSRLWGTLAEPILWRSVFFKFHDSLRFHAKVKVLNITEKGREKLRGVRSLRIGVPGDGRDYRKQKPAAVTLAPGIEKLEEVLPYLPNLQIFAIVVYSGLRMNGPEEFLGSMPPRIRSCGPSADMFASIIDALPPSVRDLCVDFSESTRGPLLSKCQMCPAVNRRLPQLENLALHLRTFCPNVLASSLSESPKYPLLKSVIVRLQGFRTRECCWSNPSPYRRNESFFDVDQYTTRIHNLHNEGVFPSLKHFLIISKRRPVGIQQDLNCKWTLYVRDIATNQTGLFPRLFLEQQRTAEPGNTFTYPPRTLIRFPTSCSFINEWRLGNEYVGACGTTRRMVGLTFLLSQSKINSSLTSP